MDVRLLDRLRVLAPRRRWLIGMAVGSACRQLTAALVGADGRGLSSRVEVPAHRQLTLPRETTLLFRRLRRGRARSPADAGLLAAQLAESQAVLLDELATEIAPVWDRVLAVAVDDPGLWSTSDGLRGYVSLCDSARLADLTGLNVVDAFPARDLAQDGRGRPLLPIPNWILLHDLQKTRVLVDVRRGVALTYLPGSRDAAGAMGVLHVKLKPCDAGVDKAAPAEKWAGTAANAIATQFPQLPPIEELVLCESGLERTAFASRLAARLPKARILGVAELGIARAALKPAGVGVLGLLHLDQTPTNTTLATGARTPRLLGRLTPGSLANWHRLVRELAGSKPSVMALRSAV